LELPDIDCAFCTYLRGDVPYTILERGPVVSVLVTFEQRGLGHVLVIPTVHRPTILELTPAEATEVMATTIRCTQAIVGAYDPAGVAVWQNNGIPAHQSVPHVHVHVAGTFPGRGTEFGDVPRLPTSETDAIADRLRPHLRAPGEQRPSGRRRERQRAADT
jgi:histidine triad (HIT) family protein